jgi:hypothetical protein
MPISRERSHCRGGNETTARRMVKKAWNAKMPYQTDGRLKGYLDTNLLYREQLCLSVSAIDKRFSDVRPRRPRGGPDGARDIDAVYQGVQRVFGAVGFVNQANDSDEHKKEWEKELGDGALIHHSRETN